MYGVIIEWDGDTPPSTYYHRVHRLGLFVHGDKDASPIARRLAKVRQQTATDLTSEIGASVFVGGVISDYEAAVVAQEGFVLCASMTLARLVASIAANEGAKLVKIGNVDFAADDGRFVMNQDDANALARVEAVFGRLGRPPKEKADYVVTCHEEAMSFFVPQQRDIVVCPHCSGVRIHTRMAQFVPKFKPYSKGSLEDYWLASRFSGGFFEIPEESFGSVDPDIDQAYLNDDYEVKIATRIVSNVWPKGLSPSELLDVMDAMFCSLCFFTNDERRNARMSAIMCAFKLGALPTSLEILSDEDKPDLFDAACVLHDKAAELHIKSKKGDHQ